MNAITPTPAVATSFEFEGNEFRTATLDGEPIFLATDLARALGYRDAGNMTRSLDADETTTQTVSGAFGEERGVIYVTEPGLYRAIMMRRSVKTLAPETREKIVRFQRWATHDVIPSIRRTGSYTLPAAQPQPAADIDAWLDPERAMMIIAHHAKATLVARAALAAEQEAHSDTFAQLEDMGRIADNHRARAESTGRELVVAREVLAEQAPVVEAFRRFRDSGKAENLRSVARILCVENHTDFFKWLRERGWFFDKGGWIQARASMLRGRLPLCIIRQVTCSDGKERWQTLVTPHGQIWLHDRWQARRRILAAAAAGAAPPVDPTLFDDED